jgi:nucleotide-binding universal stress UspA family protein
MPAPAATANMQFVGVTERMWVMKLIVHGTDGSPEANEALDLAIDLAKESGAKLAVVAVHVLARGGKGLSPPITQVEAPHGAEHLAETAAATANAAGVDTKPYVATGDPAKEITRLAEELGADLIVVGSRGFGAVHGALVGSVSRGVMTRSKIPVTVVTHRPVRETATA